MRTSVELFGRAASLVPRRLSMGLYRMPTVARAIRSLLNAALPGGIQQVKVVSGPLAGTRMVLDLRAEKYFWLGTYEPAVEASLLEYLKPGMAAWDVGAFIGYHTLLLRTVAGPGRVVAVEPDPANLARLRRHLSENGADDVRVIPAAAGARPGKGQLNRRDGHPSETRVISAGSGPCEVVTLDGLLDHVPVPGLVKMDVEGAEADVLAGAPQLLEKIRPVWIIELHGAGGAQAVSLLRQAGYRVAALDAAGPVPDGLPTAMTTHVVARS
jgi:FkbM family methyltransferase